MPRNRVIYANEGFFTGPGTGYSYMRVDGGLDNSGVFNLVFPLHRVQSVTWDAVPSRTDLQAFGKNGYLARPQTAMPDVSCSFEYLQHGIINELRLGFNTNYTEEQGINSGNALYSNNSGVDLLSTLMAVPQNANTWPPAYRDHRNFYLVTETEGNDINLPTKYQYLHENAARFSVAGFGGCYISNYTARASVGDFPRVTVAFTADNMKFYLSGSGLPNPAVDSKSGYLVQNRIFSIPNFQSGTYNVSVLRPGDITLDITSEPSLTGIHAIDGTGYDRGVYPANSYLENLGFKLSDIKIQNYELSLPLPRKPLRSIGYKLALNKVIDFPVPVTISLTAILGDTQSGDFTQLMRQDDDYNIAIKLRNPKTAARTGVAVQYDLIRVKLEDLQTEGKVGALFKSVSLKFRGEANRMFMSGILNERTPNPLDGYLQQETGIPNFPYVLQEDGVSRIRLEVPNAPFF